MNTYIVKIVYEGGLSYEQLAFGDWWGVWESHCKKGLPVASVVPLRKL